MADYQHYTSFILTNLKNGRKYSLADDFNAFIKNTNDSYYERECMPNMEDITDKDSNIDGERYIDAKYSPRELNFTIHFHDYSDYEEFKKVVGGKKLFKFEYEDDWTYDKYLLVKLKGGFSTRTYYNFIEDENYDGEIDITFIAYDPYWKIDNERLITFNDLKAGDLKYIKSKGNTDTSPIIYFIPNTNIVKINWNGITSIMKNLLVGREYVIKCESEEFYYIENGNKINCISNYESDDGFWTFPKIEIDISNNFKIVEGSVRTMKISPNSKII